MPQQETEAGRSRKAARGLGPFAFIAVGLSLIGTALIVIMAIAVNADVIGRNLFHHPVPGVTEFLGLAIVSVVFLQLANTSREERHISNDLMMAAIARRAPRVALVFYGLFQVIGAIIFALIVWFVIPIFVENYQGGYYKGTPGFVEIPVWPFLGTVIIGSAAACLQYLLLAWREFRRAFARKPDV